MAAIPSAGSTAAESAATGLVTLGSGAGPLLSLGGLGIAAAATILAFFGTGLSLLTEHPAEPDRAPSPKAMTEHSRLAPPMPPRSASVMAPPVAPRSAPLIVPPMPPIEPERQPFPATGDTSAPPRKVAAPSPPGRSGASSTTAVPATALELPPAAPGTALPQPAANGAVPPVTAPPPPPSSPPPRGARRPDNVAKAPAPNIADTAPPVPAAPSPAVASQPKPNLLLPSAEITTLLAQGDAAFRDGDLTSARLYYLRAFGAGDGRGALGIGASYDPFFLRRFYLWTQHPDLAEARAWYERAHALGAPEAASRLAGLRAKPEAKPPR
jgi:hypothetical protein